MLEKEFLESIIKHVRDNTAFINHSKTIFEISEGDLLAKVIEDLGRQLSGDSSRLASMRAAPINIMNKINQKLSKLYVNGVKRTTENPRNQELVDFYKEKADDVFHIANENFNYYKNTNIEIFEQLEERSIHFRSNPSHTILPFSIDSTQTIVPEGFVKLMGRKDDKEVFWIYTKDKFVSIDSDASIITKDLGETNGINPYGVLPFTYILRSKYLMIPKPDKDLLQMTLLVPVLLTDQNFASMFLSMPILYGINVDGQNLNLSPNMFWNVKSDDVDKTASVGVLKAEPNLESMMNSTLNQLSIYLETRNIRPGTIGKINGENFSSGISKLISEMDTLEDRKMQQNFFQNAETDFWRRLGVIHNIASNSGRLENKQKFVEPEKMNVQVEYPEEKVIETRDQLIERQKKELDAGLTSKRRAIKKLNPKMQDDEIDQLIKEINLESGNSKPQKELLTT